MYRRIRASDLAWLNLCERRLWLDDHAPAARKGPVTVQARILADQGIVHERAIMAAKAIERPATRVDPNLPLSEQLGATLALMREGVAVIEQALIEAPIDTGHVLRARADRLERREFPSSLGAWSYAPIEIKKQHTPTDAARLQLDAALWILHEHFGSPATGELWLGQDTAGQPLAVELRPYDAKRLPAAISRLRAIFAAETPPPLWFDRPCTLCPWAAECTRQAREQDDLVRLPGLRKDTWAALRQQGVTTLHELAALPPERLVRLPGVGVKTTATLLSAARAISDGVPVVRASHPLPPLGLAIDFETDPRTQAPWAWGWAQNEDNVTVILCAPGKAATSCVVDETTVIVVGESGAGWALLHDAAQRARGRLAHWGPFDATVIGTHAPSPVREALRPRLINADQEMHAHVALPLERTAGATQGGLKGVGAWLGITWPEGVSSGLAAWPVFKRWRDQGDAASLASLVAYQRSDLVAVVRAWQWLTNVVESV